SPGRAMSGSDWKISVEASARFRRSTRAGSLPRAFSMALRVALTVSLPQIVLASVLSPGAAMGTGGCHSFHSMSLGMRSYSNFFRSMGASPWLGARWRRETVAPLSAASTMSALGRSTRVSPLLLHSASGTLLVVRLGARCASHPAGSEVLGVSVTAWTEVNDLMSIGRTPTALAATPGDSTALLFSSTLVAGTTDSLVN